MLGDRAREAIESTTSSSFACDLRKWLQIMQAYEGGGHAYHATMPTDGIRTLAQVMAETEALGFDTACSRQRELGARVRAVLSDARLAGLDRSATERLVHSEIETIWSKE